MVLLYMIVAMVSSDIKDGELERARENSKFSRGFSIAGIIAGIVGGAVIVGLYASGTLNPYNEYY